MSTFVAIMLFRDACASLLQEFQKQKDKIELTHQKQKEELEFEHARQKEEKDLAHEEQLKELKYAFLCS